MAGVTGTSRPLLGCGWPTGRSEDEEGRHCHKPIVAAWGLEAQWCQDFHPVPKKPETCGFLM